MKLRFSIVTLLIFIHLTAQAQITFSPVYRKFHKELKARFYIDRIIDARTDTSTFVGTVVDTIAKTVTEIEFEKSVKPSLKESLDFAVDKDDKAIPIILKINCLEYGKRKIKKKENVLGIYFDIELYIKQSDKYQKVGDIQKAFEGIKLTGSDNIDFSNLTWYAFKEILEDFVYKSKLKPVNDNLYTEIDLIKSKKLPPIFSTASLKDGIYLNHKEFLEANPAYYSKEIGECKFRFDGKVFYVTGNDGKEQKIGSNFDLWAIVEKGQILHAFRSGNLARYEYVYLQPLGTTFEISGIGQKIYNKRLEEYRKKEIKRNMNLETIMRIFSANSVGSYNLSAFLAINALGRITGSENSRYMINTSTGQLENIPFINLSR